MKWLLKVAVITVFVTSFGEKTYAAEYNIPFKPANNTQYFWCTTEFWTGCGQIGSPFAWFDADWQGRDWDSARQMCVILNKFPFYKIYRTQEPVGGGCNGRAQGIVLCSNDAQKCSPSEGVHGCWTEPPNPLPPPARCSRD